MQGSNYARTDKSAS